MDTDGQGGKDYKCKKKQAWGRAEGTAMSAEKKKQQPA